MINSCRNCRFYITDHGHAACLMEENPMIAEKKIKDALCGKGCGDFKAKEHSNG